MLISVYLSPQHSHSLIPTFRWAGHLVSDAGSASNLQVCLKKQETQRNPYLALTSGPYGAERSREQEELRPSKYGTWHGSTGWFQELACVDTFLNYPYTFFPQESIVRMPINSLRVQSLLNLRTYDLRTFGDANIIVQKSKICSEILKTLAVS